MGEKQSHDAAVEAQRDVAQRRHAPTARFDAIGRYLAGVAYETSHDKSADRDHNGPKHRQPADEATER